MVAEQPKVTEETANPFAGLVVDSFEVENFRAFRHLTIPKVGRVNLITGRNNVGKTTLLEALWLFGEKGNAGIASEILDYRSDNSLPVSSGYENSPMHLTKFSHRDYGNHQIVLKGIKGDAQTQVLLNRKHSIFPTTQSVKNLKLIGGKVSSFEPLNYDLSPKRTLFLPAGMLTKERVIELLSTVELTPAEDEVATSLAIIQPGIVRVDIKGKNNTLYARSKDFPEPVPLAVFGDGMNRLFGICLALVNTRDGLLLIDEIENGLHYSVLPDVWKLIFATARRLNVQVFATTHSWDCIEAFQQAAADDTESEGVLIRLQRDNQGEITSTIFDERRLEVVTRRQIEVR